MAGGWGAERGGIPDETPPAPRQPGWRGGPRARGLAEAVSLQQEKNGACFILSRVAPAGSGARGPALSWNACAFHPRYSCFSNFLAAPAGVGNMFADTQAQVRRHPGHRCWSRGAPCPAAHLSQYCGAARERSGPASSGPGAGWPPPGRPQSSHCPPGIATSRMWARMLGTSSVWSPRAARWAGPGQAGDPGGQSASPAPERLTAGSRRPPLPRAESPAPQRPAPIRG